MKSVVDMLIDSKVKDHIG